MILVQRTLTPTKIEELGILEEEREEGESEDEEFLELQKDLLEDVEQMKKRVKEHFTVTHEIGCMASFIVRTRPEVPIQGDKIKEESEAARDKCKKDEVETEEKVNQWKKNNRKWLKRKKKDRGKEKVEVSVVGEYSNIFGYSNIFPVISNIQIQIFNIWQMNIFEYSPQIFEYSNI